MKREDQFPGPVAGRLIRLLLLSESLKKEDWEGGLQSSEIAAYLGVTAETVRKDISRLSPVGKQQGYRISELKRIIENSLLPEKKPGIGIVGMGFMGQALVEIISATENLDLKVCFDTNINRLERLELSIPLYPAYEIPRFSREFCLKTIILCCLPEESWRQAERCDKGGIETIINMSGCFLDQTQYTAEIVNFNLAAELLRMCSGC